MPGRGLEGIETAAGSITALLPTALMVILVMAVIIYIVIPAGSKIEDARSQSATQKAKAYAADEEARNQGIKLIGLRDDFAEWLDGAALALEIECATYPGDEERKALLYDVECSKDNNNVQIASVHNQRPSAEAMSKDAADVQLGWQALRERVNSLSPMVAKTA